MAFRAGLSNVNGYASFHWPSTESPLVDETLIEEWRATDPTRVFRAEVLAEWVDDAGAYFTSDELDGAAREFDLVQPDDAHGCAGVAGVDWGFAHDASTVVVLSPVGSNAERLHADPDGFWVPFLAEGFRVPYARWVDRVVDVAAGFRLSRIVSEMNGVGAAPSQMLAERLGVRVEGVHTDARLKEDAFARVKVLLQNGQLVLPRHPALLAQLHGLEFESPDSGVLKIAVPERRGHDDLCMGLALAVRADPSIGVRRRRKVTVVGPAGVSKHSPGAAFRPDWAAP